MSAITDRGQEKVDSGNGVGDGFRENLSTADKQGHRLFIYPKKPEGRLYRWRSLLSIFQIGLLLGAPFIKIHGQPLLMLNIIERRFVILGQVFWPQDFHLFVLGMLCFFVFIILFTAVYGRVFCGWFCPQTVFLEMMFRKVEYWIDGDGPQQRALAQGPWTAGKLFKRVVKHTIFLGFSFVIGNVLLAYIIGSDGVMKLIHDTPAEHPGGFTAMLIFTAVFYWIYSYFREQICCFLCPYGRLQSVLLDDRSVIVSYDYKRGEPQGRFQKGDDQPGTRRDRGVGDCINCGMCSRVCPTGIDIRNGTQLECVNCTACIDACNFMMTKVGLRKGLIRYASQQAIEKGTGESFNLSPRVIGYTAVLVVLLGIMGALLVSRQDVEVRILRTRGELFQLQDDDRISNLYGISVVNKTTHDLPVSFKLESHQGQLEISGGTLVAKAGDVTTASLVVIIPRNELHPYGNRVKLGVYGGDKLLDEQEIHFIAPTPSAGTHHDEEPDNEHADDKPAGQPHD